MRRYGKNFRRSAPFIRLLAALVTGIIIQHYIDLPAHVVAISACIAIPGWLFIRLASVQQRFRWNWIGGTSICLLMMSAGAALVYARDIRHRSSWAGHQLTDHPVWLLTINESLVEKQRSFKTTAILQAVYINGKWFPRTGTVLLYFKKDGLQRLQYGARLLISKQLQPVTSSGNPGAFDYGQYCAAQGIYHQVYLQQTDYRVLPGSTPSIFNAGLQALRDKILSILKKYIRGEKEAGVAEALLIGYRNDLDKDLVQAYSNTGVVHIIAISGLHLGMIYGLLLSLFRPFRRARWARVAKPVCILIVLWGFTLLTGAAASILRSAVMFSFIVIGESLGRKTQIYNTLAASAFCLLLYDPGMLWDVGFQLSYAAVLSIVIFMKPIYRQVYCKNKMLNMIWELNSITLAAQVLTLPLILFYFHQFPNLFLFTNFIAVPLSGFILYGELLLLLVCKLPLVNVFTGKLVAFLVRQMDGVIERTDLLPFGVTDHISCTLTQAILLYAVLAALGYWLLDRKSSALVWACSFLLLFIAAKTITLFGWRRQQFLVVYNVPKQAAIDLVEGRHYLFLGDSAIAQNRSLRNFHLQPARLLYGVSPGILDHTLVSSHLIRTRHTTVLWLDRSFNGRPTTIRAKADLIILSHSPRLSIKQLAAMIDCPQYVFDSSNPLWKIHEWKKQADSLHLRHHSVPEQGAFQMAL